MRVPLGSSFHVTQFSTHATPWPYLPRFMPRRLCSIGLGGSTAAAAYRPGREVKIVAADCEGLSALAGPGRWSLVVIGIAASSVPEYLRTLGMARHAGYHRGPIGCQPAAGFEVWRQRQLRVTLELSTASPVSLVDGALLVRLPDTMSRRAFANELRDALGVVASDAVVTSRQGRRRCRDLGLAVGRYLRGTATAVEGQIGKRSVDDLFFFRPHLDADALVAVVETIVAAHLVEIAHGDDPNL